MSSPKTARGAAGRKAAAASLAALLCPARAEASRRNGAKSKGPKTPDGKARAARNALKHGLRAQKHVVLPEESAAAFAALEAALMAELAPEGALESVLARRIVAAAWRLERAERLEAELFERHHYPGGNLGLALIRDCNGPRAFDTLLRYRGGTLAELWRALRTLKALQAERQAQMREAAPTQRPDEPESRRNPGGADRPAVPVALAGNAALAWLPSWPLPMPPAVEVRGDPAEIALRPPREAGTGCTKACERAEPRDGASPCGMNQRSRRPAER